MAPSRVLVVSDERVGPLYASTICESLDKAGFSTETILIPCGESQKNPKRLVEILEFAAQKGMTRSDRFAALGGGVIGDLTGLAAGLYLRGVEYLQIPTTFLAAIDSSVGGKTAVNLSAGKNLMGMFHQPSLVVCDPDLFATLDDTNFSDGLSEAVKYAVVFDEALFATIERGLNKFDLSTAPVARCIELKNSVVSADEYDRGSRQLLNFGHTAGHAIEKLSDFSISHGHAVAMGMVIMTRGAQKLGLCKEPFSTRLETLLKKNNLPVRCSYSAELMAQAALSDKKRQGSTITLVVPQKLGQCVLHPVEVSSLKDFFAAGLSE
jgi:3-dehydroquinate synthase